MNKDRLEAFCRRFRMAPEGRFTTPHGELFVADGFVPAPTPQFPFGYYRTTFFVARDEDNILYGPEMIFDAFHDPQWDRETRKRARINRARAEGEAFLEMRARQAKKESPSLTVVEPRRG